jgi:hypothetical protein
MRRRYLWLLAVFVPTVLGLAALSYLIFAPNSQSEASTTTPIVRQAPQVEDTISDETVAAPGDADVVESLAPRNDEAPVIEPESSQRPAHAESNDIIGPPMLASSTATDPSADAPARSRGSIRLANLSAAGGGGGAPSTNGSAKTSGDSTTAPVDTSNSGSNSGGSDSSTSGGSGGVTDPNGGKGEGAGGDGGTNNENGAHDDEEQDPPVSDNDPYPTDPFPHEGEHPPVQVPEPASFGLLLLGLAGCAVGRRRKK